MDCDEESLEQKFKGVDQSLSDWNFKALKIDDENYGETRDPNRDEKFNKLATVAKHFSGVEDLILRGCFFAPKQFVKIFEMFSRMQKCLISNCNDDVDLSDVQSLPNIQHVIQQGSLIELKLESSFYLSPLTMLDCKNLKSLTFMEAHYSGYMYERSFWQHLHLEPEKIKFQQYGWSRKPNLVDFLRRRTKLKQLTCMTNDTEEILLQLSSVERFNCSTMCVYDLGPINGSEWCCLLCEGFIKCDVTDNCPYVNLSKVPHRRLSSFWIHQNVPYVYYFEYSSEAPGEVDVF